MELNDPTGYGRIMTDDENQAMRIIEQKDASEDEKKIQEVFTGILLIDGSLLRPALDEINNQNAANEYYLTDLVEILYAKGVKINCIQANPTEVLGGKQQA
jgi:bifunctional UDP-N-acetylglucosamine pyrophosphorylase/glucosamine-1-phosphate N-acetyltransferase